MKRRYEVVYKIPPIWCEIKRRFPNANEEYTVVAFNGKIYSKYKISDDLYVHEATHLDRQGCTEESARMWWKEYLTNPEFIYKEEVAAYRAQLKEYKMTHKDRNIVVRFTDLLVKELCGPLYGGLCTYQKAYNDITKL